jgi:hypothetical protein
VLKSTASREAFFATTVNKVAGVHHLQKMEMRLKDVTYVEVEVGALL